MLRLKYTLKWRSEVNVADVVAYSPYYCDRVLSSITPTAILEIPGHYAPFNVLSMTGVALGVDKDLPQQGGFLLSFLTTKGTF